MSKPKDAPTQVAINNYSDYEAAIFYYLPNGDLQTFTNLAPGKNTNIFITKKRHVNYIIDIIQLLIPMWGLCGE
jgi:hypothetical protein